MFVCMCVCVFVWFMRVEVRARVRAWLRCICVCARALVVFSEYLCVCFVPDANVIMSACCENISWKKTLYISSAR